MLQLNEKKSTHENTGCGSYVAVNMFIPVHMENKRMITTNTMRIFCHLHDTKSFRLCDQILSFVYAHCAEYRESHYL